VKRGLRGVPLVVSEARKAFEEVAELLDSKCPEASELLRSTAVDVLAYKAFPQEHWRQLQPARAPKPRDPPRTRVVGSFTNTASLPRLATMLLAEQGGEWQASERLHYSLRSMAKLSSSVLPPPDLLKEVATG